MMKAIMLKINIFTFWMIVILSIQSIQAVCSVQKITVGITQSRVINGRNISQIAIIDPSIAEIQPISTSEVLLTGISPGRTQLFIWDKSGRHEYDLIVISARAGIEMYANLISSAININTVTVDAIGDRIIIHGYVTSESEFKRIESIIKGIYPKADVQVSVKPSASPEVLSAINNAISKWQLKVNLSQDGRIIISGKVNSPSEITAVKKALEPWAKDTQFVYDISTVKTIIDENVEMLREALCKWNLKICSLPDGRILVEGNVNDNTSLETINSIISNWSKSVEIVPRLTLTAPTEATQVLIRSRVVEIDRNDTKKLGVDWARILYVEGSSGVLTYVAEDQPFIIGQPRPGPFPIFGGPPISQLDPIGARINALIDDKKASVLAQPSLVTTSGHPANILIGGEVPIPVPQSGSGGSTTITITYKPFGISLEVTPNVGPDCEISLKIKPEVSVIDYSQGIVLTGLIVPGFRTRRAETTVHVPSGCSIAIGGLISREEIKNARNIPLLSKIPILGAFFRSVEKQKKDSELLIIVTPEIVTAPKPEQLIQNEGPIFPLSANGCLLYQPSNTGLYNCAPGLCIEPETE